MLCLSSRRSLSSLLRSGFHVYTDPTLASVSRSTPFSHPDGGIENLQSRPGNEILWRKIRFQGSSLEREQFCSYSSFSGGGSANFPSLNRNFLVQLWISDKKKLKAMEKQYRKASKHKNYSENGYDSGSLLLNTATQIDNEDPIDIYVDLTVKGEDDIQSVLEIEVGEFQRDSQSMFSISEDE